MTPTADFCYIDIGSIDNKNQKLSDEENIIAADKAPSRARKIVAIGDILYSTVRPYLHNMCIVDRSFSHQPIASTGFAALTCHTGFYNEFLFYYLMSPDFDAYANDTDNAKGVAYPAINDNKLYQALIPVPPEAEQKRIVEKIRGVLPYVDTYRTAYSEAESLNNAFPDRLKKSILQEAVQGKLVPQDPADEPASVLLERIRAEKEQLIKDGKIKRDKHESVIFRRDNSHYEKRGSEEVCIDEDIPFSLPDGWCWCRFSNICYKLTDGSHNPPPKKSKGFRVISARNIRNGKILFTDEDRLCDQKGFDKENPRTQISKGDVILGIIGGSIGNTAIYEHDEPVIAQRSIAIFGALINNQYMKLLLDSPLFQQQFTSKSNGTAQGGIYLGELANMLVPLPPENEQNRILTSVSVLEKKLASM
ncbi:restriction endonuclease subunit S [Blautia sp. HCP28S3_G10]|uniref:restriction endonuclease subunit S n=1 Tax=Blautia sp. HCP28S3_G10 TaxID=3438908 RepID=UPI003F8A8BCC